MPNHLRGLILAGLRTGRVTHVLEELVAIDRERADLRRRMVAVLAYPTILTVFSPGRPSSLPICSLSVPSPQIFDEFEVELPHLTQITISSMRWVDRQRPLDAGHPGRNRRAVLHSLWSCLPKSPELQRACYQIPMVGSMWKWQSLVDFSRLMHLLLDRQVPMSEALRLTADGLRWSDLAEVSRACARDVDKGMGLVESMARYPEFPASMQPVISSGVQAERPAEAFAAAADMYRSRAGVDVGLWEAILPPVIIVFVAVGVGFLVLAMFLPLIKLISELT
jgi:type II secretory pathway component PulF